MPDFRWNATTLRDDPFRRFPREARGADLLRQLDDDDSLSTLRQTLRRLRNFGDAPAVASTQRLFISHRQADATEAQQIASIAKALSFEFWLDILDPGLASLTATSLDDERKALLTAIYIEMALLNCTHLIAVMTTNTRGSMWVPYEFGRVKGDSLFDSRVSSRLHISQVGLPEYLHLGRKHGSDGEVSDWLLTESGKVGVSYL